MISFVIGWEYSLGNCGILYYFRRDDILVSAPLFMEHLSTHKLREVGQVYVYLQKEGYLFSPKPEQTLSGTQAYGRFGFSVAPLGDINHDGFNGNELLLAEEC